MSQQVRPSRTPLQRGGTTTRAVVMSRFDAARSQQHPHRPTRATTEGVTYPLDSVQTARLGSAGRKAAAPVAGFGGGSADVAIRHGL